MGIKLKNNVISYLATAISSADTSIALMPGTGASFPVLAAGDYFYATLDRVGGALEIVRVTDRDGDLLTVLRAQEGTTARSFPSGSRISMRVTSASIIDAIQEYAGAGGGGGSGTAYTHFQWSAATTWTINHNLGVRPAVTIIDSGGNDVEADVVHMSANQTVINFTIPTSGVARLT